MAASGTTEPAAERETRWETDRIWCSGRTTTNPWWQDSGMASGSTKFGGGRGVGGGG